MPTSSARADQVEVETEISKTNAEYQELLEKLQDIPTLPSIAIQVNQLINDPTSSFADITELLKKDQVLTAKILRLANSSYYSIPGGVSDVQRALAFLGFNTLAQLVLGLSVMSLFSDFDGEDFSMLEFWKHALGTAVLSKAIAKRIDHENPEEAFTCGLLHDIGKLVMHEVDQERLARVIKTAKERECSFSEVEREWDLPGHPFLGDVIAEKWGLPQLIRTAIRYHHQDVNEMSTFLPSQKTMIQIVRLANTVCVKNRIGKSGDCSEGKVTPDMLTPLGLSYVDIEALEEQMTHDMERAGAFLSVAR